MELWRNGRPVQQLGGRYTLISPLGIGGMADVCLARDEQNKQEVAAKVMIPDVTDPGRPQRFLQEGKTARELHHQHIIAVYDFGDYIKTAKSGNIGHTENHELKIPYIIMEHVKGGSLKERFQKQWNERRRASPLEETLHIFEQLCAAVQYVHNKGLIHRDIKPANILFREPPQEGGLFEVVLSDFGLAVADNDTLSHPQAGSLLYMAPEQQQGHPQKASDIFSLGVVFYQLCTGHLPFQIKDLTLPSQQPTQPAWLNPSLPPALNDVILRALSNDPSQRFANASLFWQSVQSATKRPPHSQSNQSHKVHAPSNQAQSTSLPPIVQPPVIQPSASLPSITSSSNVPIRPASSVVGETETASNTSSQRRDPDPRPASNSAKLPTEPDTQKPPPPKQPTPLPSQAPHPQIEDENKDAGFLPITTDTEYDDALPTDTPDDPSAVAAALGPGLPVSDNILHPSSTGQSADPNIDTDNDWEALPPFPAQSIPSQLPTTPAAMGTDTASRKTSGTSSRPPIDPAPIVLGTPPPLPRGTNKKTKDLRSSTTADTANPPSMPTTLPSPISNGNTGLGVATGVSATSTGPQTPSAPPHPTTNGGQTSSAPTRPPGKRPTAPARNAGAGNTLTPSGNTNAISAGWPPRRLRSQGSARPANRNRLAILLVALLVVLTLLVIGGLTFSANPGMASNLGNIFKGNATPPSTVTITPFSKTVQDTYVLTSVNGDSNIANRQVGTRQLTSTKTDTKQVTLTHVHQDSQSATGNITFFNGDTTQHTIKKAEVIFQVNGIQIAIDQDAVVPVRAATQLGQITVNAHALQGGKAGNIAAGAIDLNPCCGNSTLSAVNQNAFTGGTDAVDYNVLKQSDVNGVTNADQGMLKTSAQNDIKGQEENKWQLLGDIKCNDPNVTSDVTPGAQVQVTTANVTVSVTCNAEVYDVNAIQTVVQNTLPQTANKDSQLGRAPVLAGTITSQIQSQPQPDGSVTFTVNASGLWYSNWTDADKQALLNKIAGLSKTQAQAILNSYPGISNATITLNSGTTLPTDVNLKINPPTGPSGGSNQTATPTRWTPTSTSSGSH